MSLPKTCPPFKSSYTMGRTRCRPRANAVRGHRRGRATHGEELSMRTRPEIRPSVHRRRQHVRWLAPMLLMATVAAACGSDDDDEDGSATTAGSVQTTAGPQASGPGTTGADASTSTAAGET